MIFRRVKLLPIFILSLVIVLSLVAACGKSSSTPSPVYKVEYLPGTGTDAPAQGKTTFQLKITKQSDGSAATGLHPQLELVMSGMGHGTPVDSITESAPGCYDCTVYYLMGGPWEMKVTVEGDTTTVDFTVASSMGVNTRSARLKGITDIISSMTGTEKRSYYLFRDGLVSGTTSTFSIFVAAKESSTSYPAISLLSTTTLHDPDNSPWTVNSVTIQASTDEGFSWTSSPAIETAAGHWSIGGLTGLSSGVTGTVYVKLSVNGEDKSLDGLASNPSGTNMYATFTVIP